MPRYTYGGQALTQHGDEILIGLLLEIELHAELVDLASNALEGFAQALFRLEFIAALKKRKFRTYLETAGVHPKALASVARHVDVVSMDMKLPSATGKVFWKEHGAFLRAGRGKIFVKVVIEKKSKGDKNPVTKRSRKSFGRFLLKDFDFFNGFGVQ